MLSIADLILSSGLAGLVWFGALHQALYDDWAAVVFFSVITLLTVFFLIFCIYKKQDIRLPFAIPLAVCLAAMALSLRHSYDFTATLWDCWGWVYVFIAYMLFANTGAQSSGRRLFIGLSSAAAILLAFLAIQQILQFLPHGRSVFWGGVTATLLNSNVLAGFCLFWIFPLFLFRAPSWIEHLSRACVLFLLFVSGSWAAWVALSLGGLFLLRHHKRFPAFAAAVLFGALVMTALKLAPWAPGEIKERNRWIYFKAATHMIEKEPLTGVGLNGYAVAYPYFKAGSPAENTRLAHSFPLQMAAETGIVGLLAWMGLAFLWLSQKSEWSLTESLEQAPFQASLIAVLSFSLVSISMDYLLNRYVLFVLFAILTAKDNRFDFLVKSQSAKGLMIVFVLLLSPFWLTLFRAEQFYAAGSYARALTLNPRLGDAWAGLADLETDPVQSRRLRLTAWHWKKDRNFLLLNRPKNTP